MSSAKAKGTDIVILAKITKIAASKLAFFVIINGFQICDHKNLSKIINQIAIFFKNKKKIVWKFFYSLGITFDLAVTAMMLIIAIPNIITAIVPNSGTT